MKSFVIIAASFFGAVLADVIPEELPEEYFRRINNIEPRIIGGNYARPKQFPYQVGISIDKKEGLYWCGGSVISANWVLTAARCFNGWII